MMATTIAIQLSRPVGRKLIILIDTATGLKGFQSQQLQKYADNRHQAANNHAGELTSGVEGVLAH